MATDKRVPVYYGPSGSTSTQIVKAFTASLLTNGNAGPFAVSYPGGNFPTAIDSVVVTLNNLGSVTLNAFFTVTDKTTGGFNVFVTGTGGGAYASGQTIGFEVVAVGH
jgi:hypothetical protein